MDKSELTQHELEIYEAGVADGIQQMKDKIVKHYEMGKPVEANGRVWFIKSDMENLKEMMGNMNKEWEENWEKEHGIPWKEEYKNIADKKLYKDCENCGFCKVIEKNLSDTDAFNFSMTCVECNCQELKDMEDPCSETRCGRDCNYFVLKLD